jgi:PAS domain S-box-containing protein
MKMNSSPPVESGVTHTYPPGMIAELLQSAQHTPTMRQFAKRVLTFAAEMLGGDICEVLQLSDDGRRLQLLAGLPRQPGEQLEPDFPLVIDSLADFTLRTQQPVVVQDMRTETRFRAPLLPTHHHVVSGLCFPISGRTRPFGLLALHTTRRHHFTKEQVDFAGVLAQLLALAMVRQEAEENLRLQSLMLDAVQEAVVATNLEGHIHFWNQAASRLYGFDAAQSIGRPLLEKIPLAANQEEVVHWRRRLQQGRHWSAECRLPHQSGFSVLVQIEGFPLRDRLGALTGMITVHTDISERRWVEQALRQAQDGLEQQVAERTQELVHANQLMQQEISERDRLTQELGEMRRLLHNSQEAERLRLARELHDGPLQELTALSMELSLLAADLHEEERVAQVLALRAKQERTSQRLRLLTQDLRPPLLIHFGLGKALQSYAERLSVAYSSLTVTLTKIDEVGALPDDMALALYRIYQQAMQNIVQHAEATHIAVQLWVEDQRLFLEVADDGKGFTVPANWLEQAREGHFGVVGIVERVEALGGRLAIESAPGQGTVVRVQVPLPAH